MHYKTELLENSSCSLELNLTRLFETQISVTVAACRAECVDSARRICEELCAEHPLWYCGETTTTRTPKHPTREEVMSYYNYY